MEYDCYDCKYAEFNEVTCDCECPYLDCRKEWEANNNG